VNKPEGSNSQSLTIRDWLELTVEPGDVGRSREAILLARDFIEALPLLKDGATSAKLVLLANGDLAAARFGDVYFGDASKNAGLQPILHPQLARDDETSRILREFGVKDAEDVTLPADVLRRLREIGDDEDVLGLWRQFWLLMMDSSVNEVCVDDAFTLLDEFDFQSGQVLLPNESGDFEEARSMFTVGVVLGLHSQHQDKRWLVKVELSEKFGRQLVELGVSDRPRTLSRENPWLDEFKVFLGSLPALKTRAKVDRWVREMPLPPSHLALLDVLSPESCARLVVGYLNMGADALIELTDEEKSQNLLLWAIRQKGFLPSSRGPLRCDDVLSSRLETYRRVLPIPDITAVQADLLELSTDVSSLDQAVLIDAIRRLEDESDSVLIGSTLVLLASSLEEVPSLIPAHLGKSVQLVSPESVSVVTTRSAFEDHQELKVPVIQVSSEMEVASLVDLWRTHRSVVEGSVIFSSAEDEKSIVEEFQGLIEFMGDTPCERFRSCVGLERRIATKSGYKDFPDKFRIEGDCVYIDTVDLVGSMEERDEQVLGKLVSALGISLNSMQIKQILDSRRSADARETERKCRELARHSKERGVELAAKILATLFTLEELLRLLPVSLADQIGDEREDPLAVAKLALAVWGVEVLTQPDAKNALRRRGHNVPKVFAGTFPARDFVRNLGLDSSYAGFPPMDREKHLEVYPKTEPVNLHEYQVGVQVKMREFFRMQPASTARGWRSLLYMPTGAGKTRVTVQSVVDAINDGDLKHRRIIWIAGSDELCEQAVQTFSDVWRSSGLNGLLSIERLWGNNEAVEEEFDEGCVGQVVVATYQKLSANITNDQWHPEYEWLRRSGLVIIDEAHSAAGQAFTGILAALGFDRNQRDRSKDPMPLLGLTATPKDRIRSRFGGVAGLIGIDLPSGVTDFEHLKNIKVLSKVSNEVIDGMVIERADSEPLPKNFPRNPWLPSAYDQQIESNEERNKAIIDHIKSQMSVADSLILVFAASVAHAQILAALLTRAGVDAAAVSANTPKKLRQHYVKEFQEGRIRVLTNYGVLTQGFDNPKVNVVYVTRPVFSAAAYLQMVGRGLRGPANGGTENCLIVDIDDNLENFPDLKLVYQTVNEWFDNDGNGDLPDDLEDIEDVV
jgi:superfamily II DNA or RNA helicase